MSIKGYPTQEKNKEYQSEFATIEPVRTKQHALSVLAHMFMSDVASDLVESESTAQVINATGHVAKRGDVIVFTSGALSGLEVKVWMGSEDSDYEDSILLAETLPSAPANGVAFDILRHRYPKVSDLGAASVSFSPPDIVDLMDGDLLITESTSIPASSSTPLTVVASLNAAATKVRVADTTGQWIGVYEDPSGTPALLFVINPGADRDFEVSIPASTEIGVRNMYDSAISVGQLCLHFLA